MTRGQIAHDNGQLPEAEKWLRQAARALPYDYRAHWLLTKCLLEEGKNQEAEVEEAYANRLKDRWTRFSDLTTHDMSQRRNDPALYCEAAKLMFELGNPEGAKHWLSSALLVNNDYVPALEALADYYDKKGDSATAQEYRQKAKQSAAPQTNQSATAIAGGER